MIRPLPPISTNVLSALSVGTEVTAGVKPESLAELEAALRSALVTSSLDSNHPWYPALGTQETEVAAALALPVVAGVGSAAVLAGAYLTACWYYRLQGRPHPEADAVKWICDQLQSAWNLSQSQVAALAMKLKQPLPAAGLTSFNWKQTRRDLEIFFRQVVEEFRPIQQPAVARGTPRRFAQGSAGGSPEPQLPPILTATGASQQEHALLEKAQQQLAQFYWNAAGGIAGRRQTRESLQQLQQISSAWSKYYTASASAVKTLQSSLPPWLKGAQQYLNNVSPQGHSATLPPPPAGAASGVQQAFSAAAKALTPPGERLTIVMPQVPGVGKYGILIRPLNFGKIF